MAPSKTVLSEVEGFTPLMDILAEQYQGVITAAVFGRVWRYCQGAYGKCSASLQTIADELGLSYATVLRHVKTLCDDEYLKDETPELRNRPHTYADTGKVTLQVLLKAGLSESKSGLSESKSGLSESKSHSIRETDEDTIRDNSREKEKREEEEKEKTFEDFEGHPNSIRNKPEAPISEGYNPSVAEPHTDLPEVEELARQLAPPIDWVWGFSKKTDAKLLHAAQQLLTDCKGDVGGALEALDDYCETDGEWARENLDDPHGLTTLVFKRYAKLQGQAERQAATRSDWAEHAELSQTVLAEQRAEAAKENRDPWWEAMLGELRGCMTKAVFDQYLAHATARREDDLTIIAVRSAADAEWMVMRMRPVLERVLGPVLIEVKE